MSSRILVLGAGYAGASALTTLESTLGDREADLVWVSEEPHHLLVHELHRVIRDPTVAETVTIPVEQIADDGTTFVQGTVTDLDADARAVALEDGTRLDYDYLVACLGSRTDYQEIDGLESNALTLKRLDDALAVHDEVVAAAANATPDDPARVVVGGAGLSGVQSAGELAELRDIRDAPIEIELFEAMENVFPGHDPEFQGAIVKRLRDHDVEIKTDDLVDRVDDAAVHFEEREPIEYDVLLWTGGVTGQDAFADAGVETDANRPTAAPTLRTSDDRVFAVGDCALVEQTDGPAPPTAQAAWDAAEVAAKNVVRSMRAQPLETWHHHDMGTLVSVGEDVVAHDVDRIPLNTFGGPGARLLKKAVGARWIASVAPARRIPGAWGDL